MKKFFKICIVEISTISILFFLLLLGTAYSQEKQKACLAPMGSLGEISDMEKQILNDGLGI